MTEGPVHGGGVPTSYMYLVVMVVLSGMVRGRKKLRSSPSLRSHTLHFHRRLEHGLPDAR